MLVHFFSVLWINIQDMNQNSGIILHKIAKSSETSTNTPISSPNKAMPLNTFQKILIWIILFPIYLVIDILSDVLLGVYFYFLKKMLWMKYRINQYK